MTETMETPDLKATRTEDCNTLTQTGLVSSDKLTFRLDKGQARLEGGEGTDSCIIRLHSILFVLDC